MAAATQNARYIPCAETAKLVRTALKGAFPGVKFSVRSKTYSGGASIDVNWTDGPLTRAVEAVAKQYAGGRFDGMIDLAYSVTNWLRPTGATMVAKDPGTGGSRGSDPGEDNTMFAAVIPDDAELVHFGANYVFCSRDISDKAAKVEAATAWIFANCTTEGEGRNARFGNEWVTDIAQRLVYGAAVGESIEAAFERGAGLRWGG